MGEVGFTMQRGLKTCHTELKPLCLIAEARLSWTTDRSTPGSENWGRSAHQRMVLHPGLDGHQHLPMVVVEEAHQTWIQFHWAAGLGAGAAANLPESDLEKRNHTDKMIRCGELEQNMGTHDQSPSGLARHLFMGKERPAIPAMSTLEAYQ